MRILNAASIACMNEVLGHAAGLLGRLTTRMELDVDGDSGALVQGACNVNVGGNESDSLERPGDLFSKNSFFVSFPRPRPQAGWG